MAVVVLKAHSFSVDTDLCYCNLTCKSSKFLFCNFNGLNVNLLLTQVLWQNSSGQHTVYIHYYPQTRRWPLPETKQMRMRRISTTRPESIPTIRSLHTTRNATCFHSVCSTTSVRYSHLQAGSNPPHGARHTQLSWAVVCSIDLVTWGYILLQAVKTSYGE
jgi:hypothetical protein